MRSLKRSFTIIAVCTALSGAAESADTPRPPGLGRQVVPAAPQNHPPAQPGNTPPATTIIRGQRPGGAAAVTPEKPKAPVTRQEQFTDRLRKQEAERKKQEWEWANRPTAWQLQNPSGEQNRFATDDVNRGYTAPNTYFGAQFRDWSGLSAPAYERQLPPGMNAVPPLTSQDVMIAPYSYWGAENQMWNQVSPGGATMDPLGGWNTRVGW